MLTQNTAGTTFRDIEPMSTLVDAGTTVRGTEGLRQFVRLADPLDRPSLRELLQTPFVAYVRIVGFHVKPAAARTPRVKCQVGDGSSQAFVVQHSLRKGGGLNAPICSRLSSLISPEPTPPFANVSWTISVPWLIF